MPDAMTAFHHAHPNRPGPHIAPCQNRKCCTTPYQPKVYASRRPRNQRVAGAPPKGGGTVTVQPREATQPCPATPRSLAQKVPANQNAEPPSCTLYRMTSHVPLRDPPPNEPLEYTVRVSGNLSTLAAVSEPLPAASAVSQRYGTHRTMSEECA